jgi:hypothetical protein
MTKVVSPHCRWRDCLVSMFNVQADVPLEPCKSLLIGGRA